MQDFTIWQLFTGLPITFLSLSPLSSSFPSPPWSGFIKPCIQIILQSSIKSAFPALWCMTPLPFFANMPYSLHCYHASPTELLIGIKIKARSPTTCSWPLPSLSLQVFPLLLLLKSSVRLTFLLPHKYVRFISLRPLSCSSFCLEDSDYPS